MNDSPLMTKAEVCQFFGAKVPLHPRTLDRWIRKGLIPRPVKLGGKIRRWRKTECEQALADLGPNWPRHK